MMTPPFSFHLLRVTAGSQPLAVTTEPVVCLWTARPGGAGRLGGDAVVTLPDDGSRRVDAGKEVNAMTRPRAWTGITVLALADARMRLRSRLANDGELSDDDRDAMLLLDAAAVAAAEADFERRRRRHQEDTGEDSTPWFDRERREIDRMRAPVAHLLDAA